MQITRIEFNDPDDLKTNDGKIRLSITPEGMILALPNSNKLTSADQEVFGQIIRLAYQQGKEIGYYQARNDDLYKDSEKRS
jgi:hypothetical protein